MPTFKFLDRDLYLQLLKEEAEAEAQVEPENPAQEEVIADRTLADEIAALRNELQTAITRLRADLTAYRSAIEDSLS